MRNFQRSTLANQINSTDSISAAIWKSIDGVFFILARHARHARQCSIESEAPWGFWTNLIKSFAHRKIDRLESIELDNDAFVSSTLPLAFVPIWFLCPVDIVQSPERERNTFAESTEPNLNQSKEPRDYEREKSRNYFLCLLSHTHNRNERTDKTRCRKFANKVFSSVDFIDVLVQASIDS